jgi:hypothetical protein
MRQISNMRVGRPPGPSPVPFVGNKWDLPPCKPWYKFKQWTDMYGSLVTVWTGRRPTVVIGDPKVACDLLDRRSAIYSSRPRFVVMGMLSFAKLLSLFPSRRLVACGGFHTFCA